MIGRMIARCNLNRHVRGRRGTGMPKGKQVARCNLNRHVRGRRALVCPRENKLRVVTRTTMFEEKLHALRLKHL